MAEQWPTLLCAVVVVVTFVVTFLRVTGARRARSAQIARYTAWARQRGLRYAPSDPSVANLSTLPPFGVGHTVYCLDVFRGHHRGAHLVFFHFRYVVGSGKSRSVHDYQVVAVSLPASRPLLDVSHENAFSKRFGRDIDFENQAFNDRFKVVSPNPRFAHDVIHPRTMEWMLADARTQTYTWRFEGPWLMTARPGPLKLDEVDFYADFLTDVREQVPAHVWSHG